MWTREVIGMGAKRGAFADTAAHPLAGARGFLTDWEREPSDGYRAPKSPEHERGDTGWPKATELQKAPSASEGTRAGSSIGPWPRAATVRVFRGWAVEVGSLYAFSDLQFAVRHVWRRPGWPGQIPSARGF